MEEGAIARSTGQQGEAPSPPSPARQIIAHGDHVVLERDAMREKTQGGIIIPDNAKENLGEATVIAVAEGKTASSASGADDGKGLRVGDKVLVSKYTGVETEVDGRKLLIVKADDVLCILRPAAS